MRSNGSSWSACAMTTGSWLATITVAPWRRDASARRRPTTAAFAWSRRDVGSSTRTRPGAQARARAIAPLWRSPAGSGRLDGGDPRLDRGVPRGDDEDAVVAALGSRQPADAGLPQELLREAEPAAAADHDRRLAGARRLVAEAAVADVDRAVADPRHPRVVAHENDRRPLLPCQLADQPVRGGDALRVELAGRLVCEEQGGAVGDGGADGDPLCLAAGELAGAGTSGGGEADALEQLIGAEGALRRGCAEHRHLERHDRPAVEVRRKRAPEVLVDYPHPARAQPRRPTRRKCGQVAPEHERASGRGPLEARKDAHERALAGSTRAQHGDDLLLLDAEGEALERGRIPLRGAVDAKDVAGVDRRLHHRADRPAMRATGRSPRIVNATTVAAAVGSDASARSGGTAVALPAPSCTRSTTALESAIPSTIPPAIPATAMSTARRIRCTRSTRGGTPIASRSSRWGRSSARSDAPTSTSPAAARRTASTAAASSTIRIPRASGRPASLARIPERERTASALKGGRRSSDCTRPVSSGGTPTHISSGTAVPGASALILSARVASSAIAKLEPVVGKRLPTATTWAGTGRPSGRARASRPPGPAACATSVLARSGTRRPSDGCGGRARPVIPPPR